MSSHSLDIVQPAYRAWWYVRRVMPDAIKGLRKGWRRARKERAKQLKQQRRKI